MSLLGALAGSALRRIGLTPSLNQRTASETSSPTEVEQLRERLRTLDRDARRLRAVIAMDQAQRVCWDRLEKALEPEGIHSSISRAVASAELAEAPMPHLILRDVFPAPAYDALLEALPPDDFFPDKDPVKQNLKIRQTDTAPAWTRRVLEFLEDIVIPTMLTPLLLARMRPHLDRAYREEHGASQGPLIAALPHTASAGRLMLRRPGYKLEPHLDPHRAALTCLLYLARSGDNADYGTQLLSVDRPIVVDRTNTFYPREHGYKCQVIRTAPFEPNTALVFLNRGGAHAAEIPRKAPKETRRYSYQFYVGPDPAAMEALLGR